MLPHLLGLPVDDRADITSTAPAVLNSAVAELVRSALGVEIDGPVVLEEVDYSFGSPATASLHRLRGRDATGAPWSLFCKELQHVRHWPQLVLLPPPIAADFSAQFPWRSELELWDAVPPLLPSGLRTPVLHRIIDLGDDRLAAWMEDVDTDTAWDVSTFARAAHLLGRWNARSTDPAVLGANEFPIGYGLRLYAERAVPSRGLAPLEDDALWSHPWLADHADLRTELRRLGSGLAADLDRLDSYRQTLPHGDASPQNLLVPRDGSADFVVIDLSFRTPHPLGFDLGQLLVGLVHAGQWPAERMDEVDAVIVPAYLEGLAAEGLGEREAEVIDAYRTATMVRSGFDSMRYELLDRPVDDLSARAEFDQRLGLTRFLVRLRTAPQVV